jgi:hypothetical protein
MELGGKLLNSLRIKTQFLERLQSVSVVDGATHTPKNDVESNGGSLENVAVLDTTSPITRKTQVANASFTRHKILHTILLGATGTICSSHTRNPHRFHVRPHRLALL